MTILKAVVAAAAAVMTMGATFSTPGIGQSDRVAIMDAIRETTGVSTIFKVAYLRIGAAAGIKVAYTEVSPASSSDEPFTGWVFLTKFPGKPWQSMWGLENSKGSPCQAVRKAYQGTLEVSRKLKIGRELFSPAFFSRYLALSERGDNDRCQGALITGNFDY
jgi:hypothetical protein